MLEVVYRPVAALPDDPPDPGRLAIKGVFVRQPDKPMVSEALDHARVAAWREKWKWENRVAAAADAIAGLIKVDQIPGIRKGYNNAQAAWQESINALNDASWHHQIFKAGQEGVDQYMHDPGVILQFNRFAPTVLNGIRAGVNIINRQREQEAAKQGKPSPGPKYIFEYSEEPAIRFDYQREVIIPIDMSGVSEIAGMPPPPPPPRFDPTQSTQPPVVKDSGPLVDALNPPREPVQPPTVPLNEGQPVHGAMSEVAQKILARDKQRMKDVLSGKAMEHPGTDWWAR